jgi:hypothetical protein
LKQGARTKNTLLWFSLNRILAYTGIWGYRAEENYYELEGFQSAGLPAIVGTFCCERAGGSRI